MIFCKIRKSMFAFPTRPSTLLCKLQDTKMNILNDPQPSGFTLATLKGVGGVLRMVTMYYSNLLLSFTSSMNENRMKGWKGNDKTKINQIKSTLYSVGNRSPRAAQCVPLSGFRSANLFKSQKPVVKIACRKRKRKYPVGAAQMLGFGSKFPANPK